MVKLSKPQLIVLAQAVALDEVSYHYLTPDVREARSLVALGLLHRGQDKADFEYFTPTEAAKQRLLG